VREIAPRAQRNILRSWRLPTRGCRPLSFTVRCHERSGVEVSFTDHVVGTNANLWAAMALGWPLFCAYGLLQPHTLDLEALRLGRGEVALPIGASSAQRSYVVLPRAIATASVSVVNDQHRARVPLRETRATLLLSCSFGSPPFIAPGTSGFAPCQRHLTNAWSGRES
jgi:hypothetical protein